MLQEETGGAASSDDCVATVDSIAATVHHRAAIRDSCDATSTARDANNDGRLARW